MTITDELLAETMEDNERLRAELDLRLDYIRQIDADNANLRAENERLRKLVRSAYNEGFNEGMREAHEYSKGGKSWQESNSNRALIEQEAMGFLGAKLEDRR